MRDLAYILQKEDEAEDPLPKPLQDPVPEQPAALPAEEMKVCFGCIYCVKQA